MLAPPLVGGAAAAEYTGRLGHVAFVGAGRFASLHESVRLTTSTLDLPVVLGRLAEAVVNALHCRGHRSDCPTGTAVSTP